MRTVKRSALIPYSAQQMFDLVDDIESYPEFLPWCSGAEVESDEGEIVVATLELRKGGLRKRFTTRNTRQPPEAITLALVGGPFHTLKGGWQFEDLGAEGSKAALNLSFEFESRMLDMLLGAYFEETCNDLVDAFTKRAATVYGGA